MFVKKKKSVVVVSSIVLGTVALLLNPVFSKADTPTVPPVTHPVHSELYKENPDPALKGNANAQDRFLKRDQVLAKVQLPASAKVAATDLKTWGTFVSENYGNKGGAGTELAKDRMVWVIKVDYPEGVETKGGFFANAKQTIVFDAETGRFISRDTTGDSASVNAPWK